MYVNERSLWQAFGYVIDPPLIMAGWKESFEFALTVATLAKAPVIIRGIKYVTATYLYPLIAGGANVAVSAEKLHHIFDNAEHGFANMLNSFNGNQVAAYNAIYNAAQKVVNAKGLTGIFDSVENPIVVRVGEYTIYVGGRVIDGIINIGTAYIN
jgi:hypothetical protein